MQTFREYIAAGKKLELNFSGRYFRIIECGADVVVNFYKGGRLQESADGVGIGFWSEQAPGESFDRVDIVSPVAQLVRFGIARGRGGIDAVASGGNAATTGGAVNADTRAAVRATVKLMEPGLTDPDELDAVMGFFEAWPVSSNTQAIYLLTGAVKDSAALLSATLGNLPVYFG